MKQIFVIFILSFGLFATIQAQSKDQKKIQPKEDVKVNRAYDEQGSLMHFDSTYTYFWPGDTTLGNSVIPEEFEYFFDQNFSFFNDSVFFGKSFQNDLDQLFFNPFSDKSDSLMMNHFGLDKFQSFRNNTDTMPLDKSEFSEFWGQVFSNPKDSVSAHKSNELKHSIPSSLEEMRRMMQQQMNEMEQMQQRFFEECRKSGNQPKTKDL